MADIKISALPTATTPLTGAELVPVVQGGVTKQTTATAIFTAGVLPVVNGGTGTATPALVPGSNVTITGTWPNQTINSTSSATVTNVSVVSANGLAGTVANATTTPAITLSTSVTGIVKGNGTTLSAASAGTDYVAPGGALGTPSSGTVTNLTGTASININGTVGATTPAAGTFTSLNDGQLAGLRNRIINGGMTIDQRNNGAAVTANGTALYTLDRWGLSYTLNNKYTIQQTPSTTETGFAARLGAGFTNYLATTVAVAANVTVGAGDYFLVLQKIEGLNIPDLAWGTSSAKAVTLSFWAYSSLTGTFGGSLKNSAGTRSYPFTYTISAANTWEKKTLTVTGDTTGTWLTTSGIGINVNFSLGAGSTFITTAGAWAAGNYLSATGATNVISTNSATLYLTGVQLEIGSVATPFEQRPYGMELALCQRYYFRVYPGAGNQRYALGSVLSTTNLSVTRTFPVVMRVAPSALEQSGTATDYLIAYSGTAAACSAVPTFVYGTTSASTFNFTIGSGLTVGNAAEAAANSANSYLGWSAEL